MTLRPDPRPLTLHRWARWASAAFVALALAATGCGGAGGAALTPKEIDAHGIIVLRSSPEKAFKASAEALKALGYELGVEEPEKGLLVTKRRSIAGIAADTAGAASERSYFRQYTIEIKSGGGGTTRVKVTPALFESADDISAKKVWDLESPVGERELWKQLFAKIEQLL